MSQVLSQASQMEEADVGFAGPMLVDKLQVCNFAFVVLHTYL